MAVEPPGELVGGLVGGQLVEFQSWHLLRIPPAKLFAPEMQSVAAEGMVGK